MKRFCFLFFVLFVLFAQLSRAFAKEPSFYEEFEYDSQNVTEQEADRTNSAGKQKTESQNQAQELANAETKREKRDFVLTDEKHECFLQENEQYALADAMLNLTWKELAASLDKKAYRELWKNHKKWLETDRNKIADSFSEKIPDIPEDHAFMLVTVAKTQELAQKIWRRPEQGIYKKGALQVTVTEEDGKLFVQGYGDISISVLSPSSADTDKEEKMRTQKIRQLLFRAELPKDGKLWLALTAVSDQKIYILTMKNKLCLVHAKNAFPLDFNGVFVK